MNNNPTNNNGALSNREKYGKKIDLSRFIILAVTATLIITSIIFLLLIDTPDNVPPTISLKDLDGNTIDDNYKIGMFDGTIHPGTDGKFDFVVKNPHTQKMRYSFEIETLYRGEPVQNFPIVYRVKLNNGFVNTEEWLDPDELRFEDILFLPETEHLITVEWWWPFESGDDRLDTLYGIDNGDYSVIFHITAELIEE